MYSFREEPWVDPRGSLYKEYNSIFIKKYDTILSMPLLTVDNVSIDFHGRDLLDKVSLRINEGDKIAFIGNNGAGKSTLFRIIRGTLTP